VVAKMRCAGSKLSNLVRLTAGAANRIGANVAYRAEPTRFGL